MKKNKKQQTNLKLELFNSDVLENGTAEEIESFKKSYRSYYAKNYNKKFMARTKRKTLIFSLEEFEYLQKQAEKYGMKLSPFIKAILFAYLESVFIHPEGKKLAEIEKLLREINRRIGESVQYIHLSRNITIKDIESIKLDIAELEKFIDRTIHNPIRLEEWLKDQVENDEQFLSRLLEAIAKHLTQ